MLHSSNLNNYVYLLINQESIKQKDQSIRKYEQEIDSLQFRNDQVSGMCKESVPNEQIQ